MSLSHLRSLRHRRRARWLLSAAYAAFFVGGALALAIPPRTFEGALGQPSHWMWAGMVLAGGIAGAWAATRRDWRPERWSTPLIGTGLLIYSGTLAWLAYSTDSWGRSGLAVITLGAALLVYYRGVEVDDRAKADRDAHDAATGQE